MVLGQKFTFLPECKVLTAYHRDQS